MLHKMFSTVINNGFKSDWFEIMRITKLEKLYRSTSLWQIWQPACLRYWESVNIESTEIILSSLPTIKNSVKETWLLSLQFKIVQNTLATNKRLCDWRIRQTSKCDYCEHEDTIVHYIWECHASQTIIANCLKTLKLENELETKLNLVQFIFGFNNIRLDNLSMLITNCIYQCKKTKKMFLWKRFH